MLGQTPMRTLRLRGCIVSEGERNMMRSLVRDKERLDELESQLLQLARSVEVIQGQIGRILNLLERVTATISESVNE